MRKLKKGQARGQPDTGLWEPRGGQGGPRVRGLRSRMQKEAEPQRAGGHLDKHLTSLYSTEVGGGPEGIFRAELL